MSVEGCRYCGMRDDQPNWIVPMGADGRQTGDPVKAAIVPQSLEHEDGPHCNSPECVKRALAGEVPLEVQEAKILERYDAMDAARLGIDLKASRDAFGITPERLKGRWKGI